MSVSLQKFSTRMEDDTLPHINLITVEADDAARALERETSRFGVDLRGQLFHAPHDAPESGESESN
jgi:hypothetical protein